MWALLKFMICTVMYQYCIFQIHWTLSKFQVYRILYTADNWLMIMISILMAVMRWLSSRARQLASAKYEPGLERKWVYVGTYTVLQTLIATNVNGTVIEIELNTWKVTTTCTGVREAFGPLKERYARRVEAVERNGNEYDRIVSRGKSFN